MKTRMYKNSFIAAAVGILALGVSTGPAKAVSISQYLFQNTLWEDFSVEIQEVDSGSNSLLEVGDTLRGMVEISNAVNQDAGTSVNTASAGNPELAAIFEVEVVSRTLVSLNGPGASDDTYNFVFGPHAGFATDLGLSAGAIFAFYADPAHEFEIGGPTCTVTGNGGNCEGNVVDGSLVLVLGMDGSDDDEKWTARNAPQDPSLAANFSTTANLGDFQANLSIITNNTGHVFRQVQSDFFPQVGTDGKIDVAVSGNIHGTSGLTTPYDVSDDSKFRLSVVAEPGTLGLLGISLFALGALRRQRNKTA